MSEEKEFQDLYIMNLLGLVDIAIGQIRSEIEKMLEKIKFDEGKGEKTIMITKEPDKYEPDPYMKDFSEWAIWKYENIEIRIPYEILVKAIVKMP